MIGRSALHLNGFIRLSTQINLSDFWWLLERHEVMNYCDIGRNIHHVILVFGVLLPTCCQMMSGGSMQFTFYTGRNDIAWKPGCPTRFVFSRQDVRLQQTPNFPPSVAQREDVGAVT